MNRTLLRQALAEGVGTFALTFVGAGVICTDAYNGGEVGLLGVALAHGLILAAIVTALGHVSGAHVNPAVTLAALLARAVDPLPAVFYVGAQLIGAAIAGLMLAATFSSEVWTAVNLGAPELGPGVEIGTGVFVEMILTFLFVAVILQVAADERAPRHVHGLAIGAALAACIFVGGPLTGAALNPARAFGPAFAAGFWDNHYVYWVGPFLGAAIASVVFGLLRPSPVFGVAGDDDGEPQDE